MKKELFLTREIQFLNSAFSSFNSYVYYLTRRFIASTHAFNFLARNFNLPTCAFSLSTRVFTLITRRFELVTRVLLFHGFVVYGILYLTYT